MIVTVNTKKNERRNIPGYRKHKVIVMMLSVLSVIAQSNLNFTTLLNMNSLQSTNLKFLV